jgi:hypothetical protein
MPKKTSRSARALQAQRTSLPGERKNTARPLLDVGNSRLVAESNSGEELGQLDAVFESRQGQVNGLNGGGIATATRPHNEARSNLPENGTSVIRPASSSRRPIARRATTTQSRAQTISREEEYAYIRSDLVTVVILTILMLIVLVALTFIIGR